ncbi:MAG: restriction endonuclease subunit S [Leadbetterella sp.]|nr:restriction endonuclease subunit S [Leadbetterella sp.]
MVKIKDLFHFEKGTLQSTKATPGEFDFITAAADWKSHNQYTHDCEALIFAAAASGSLGRTHYINGKFISSDLCFIITPKDPDIYPIDLKFYHLIFNSFKDEIVRNTKAGTSKEAIGLTVFGNYKLPYFDIEKQQETKDAFLTAQTLCQSLNQELSNQLELIKNLRQAFLKDAIRGKLVEQDTKDEPALMLLEKIKAEKDRWIKNEVIKKPKPIPQILDYEIRYEIPSTWTWCRLGEFAYVTSGSTPKNSAFTSEGIPFLKMYNLRDQKIDFNFKKQFIKESVHNGSLKRCRSFPGDLIMNIVGPPLGKLAIIPDSLPECNFNQAAVLIRPPILEINKYLFWYLSEMSEIKEIETKGVAGQNNISVTQAHNIKIPLPPFSEQIRIVARLNELMKFCDGVEESINKKKLNIELLLIQNLREALNLKTPSKQITIKEPLKTLDATSKFDSNTLLMEIQELLKIHGKLQALELWQMSKFYGKSDEERNIDGLYAELKKLIEKEKVVKETEKGYLELV